MTGPANLALRGRALLRGRPASQAFRVEHLPTVLEAFGHNEGFPATRNPFQGVVRKRAFPQEDGKRLFFCWGRPPFEEEQRQLQRGVFTGKVDGSVPPQGTAPAQRSVSPNTGNEGKGMAAGSTRGAMKLMTGGQSRKPRNLMVKTTASATLGCIDLGFPHYVVADRHHLEAVLKPYHQREAERRRGQAWGRRTEISSLRR